MQTPPPSALTYAQVPPQRVPPQRSWFSRNWGWVLGCGCLSVLAGSVLVIVLIFALIFSVIKNSDVYKQALARTQNSPAAQEALGSPIEAGYMVQGQVNVNNDAGNASLTIPVSGPKGAGTVTVRATRSGGKWTMDVLSLEVEGRAMPISLIGGGAALQLELPPVPPTTSRDRNKAVKLHDLGVKEYAASLKEPQRLDGALALLEEAVQRDPENNALKVDLADAYVQLGHEAALAYAIDLYEDVLKHTPQEDALLARLAEAYGQLENYKEAFRLLEQRLTLSQPNVRGVALQAVTLSIEGRQLDRGRRVLSPLVLKYPNEPGLQLLQATLLAEAGRNLEARAAIREAQGRIPPGDPLEAEAQKMMERLTP